MDPRDASIAYDELASHWAGEDLNRRNGIEQHERALRFLRSHRRAIDIGCGSSGRIVDLLLARFDRVEGLDIAPRMIELAEQRHPGVTFHQTDVCAWEPPHRYDFVSAWDSVWHVPLDAQEAMLRKLCSALEPSGVLLTTTGGTEGPGHATNPFLGQPLYHAALGLPRFLEVLHDAGCHCRHVEFDEWPEKHIVVIAQRDAED